ncbi:MAG: dihydrolipoamide acetyltransferase family protein [Bacteroidota bacterium]
MATPILLPRQGNSVETCRILSWKKKKGESVRKGETVCEVETDKAMFEIESPEEGILLDVFFDEGADVPVLTNIAAVGKLGEKYAELFPHKAVEPAPEQSNATTAAHGSTEHGMTGKPVASSSQVHPEVERKTISPSARKIAEQSGIDIQQLRGTGPGGRIIERDVMEYLASKGATRSETPSAASEREDVRAVPLKGVRKLIAERMLHSIQHSAQLTLNAVADASNLVEIRRNFKNNPKYRLLDAVTINDLVHFAVIQTLPHHPALNCLVQDENILYSKSIHLGFAVDTPRGLMVPVIKDSHKVSLLALSKEAKRLAARCIEGKILVEELNGGTFTVTNLGSFGIETFTPILNLPQAAILGVNRIAPRPVEGERGVAFIPHISFSLTIDHRVIDGVAGAKFLQDLSRAIAQLDLNVLGDIPE